MTRRNISTGSPFEERFAYSRAVAIGDWCFVAGTTGYDYAKMVMPSDAGAQAANALNTIETALTEAGFTLADTVRVQYTITTAEIRHAIAPVLQARLGQIRPASTMVVSALTEPEMLVEIEITAYRPS
ncbi:MAG: RidA family protein [Pseudomonadota bacterium]